MTLTSSVKTIADFRWKKINEDRLLILLSIMIQTLLAIFLGHYYDERVFMTTGYLVSSGINPYQQYEITGIFSHPLLQGTIPGFGYPPPYALVLGLAFQLSYRLIPNLLLYNLMIKIPIVATNVCLAFLVRKVINESKTTKKTAQFAFLFLLFNPFILLTTSAWGQIDTVATLLCVASLYWLSKGNHKWCGITLALAFSIKPIVLPLLGLPVFFQEPKNLRSKLEYLTVLSVSIFTFTILPLLVTGWQPLLASNEWNAHFSTAGGLSLFGIIEIITGAEFLPRSLEQLGFLWVPALLIAYYKVYRNPPSSRTELIQKAILLSLIFFLTRSWLSEPNINLVLVLMLLSVETEKTTFRNLHFAWTIAFLFMFLNYSIPQLFFIPYPSIISDLAILDVQIGTLRLIGRSCVVVLWQIFAWLFLFKILHQNARKDFNNSKEYFYKPSETRKLYGQTFD